MWQVIPHRPTRLDRSVCRRRRHLLGRGTARAHDRDEESRVGQSRIEVKA